MLPQLMWLAIYKNAIVCHVQQVQRGEPMKDRHLQTKFHKPAWRDKGVSRPRLMARLQTALKEQQKVILVSAPAGYGKTTLMAEWVVNLAETAVSTTWLSLDTADNDPVRFVSYFLAACQQLDATIGQSAQSLLGLPQLPPTPAIFNQLINDLTELTDPAVVFLDDYHVIRNPQIHEAIEYFLDHQPPQIHLALTTRIDPPFALARLRVRGQLCEIRAQDLRFTGDEAGQFFDQFSHVALEPDEITDLETRTEGWVAGLYLAALALQNLPNRRDFLIDFSGSHRYVIDYLMDEVLKFQTLEMQDFLRQTAVLPQFSAELCQAVTGTSAVEILHHLDRDNLFLVPLDDQRGWYRFHHLFADVLRAGLDPAAERQVRRRAAVWFTEQGMLAQAIPHWLAVPDMTQAAQLISEQATEWVKNGELQTLLGWLEALPAEQVTASPDLTAYKATCLLLTGQTENARLFVQQATERSVNHGKRPGSGRLLAIRAWLAMIGGAADCADLAQAALHQLAESDQFFRAIALVALGSDYAWNTDLVTSSRVFQQTYALGQQMDHAFVALGALANWAFNLLEMGQLRQAEALCRGALAEYVDGRGQPLPVLGIVYSPLAAICYEQGKFEEAEDFARQSIVLSQRLFSNVILGGDSEIVLARIAFHKGSSDQALALLAETGQTARRHNVQIVVYKTAVVTAELHLLMGNTNHVRLLLEELATNPLPDLPKTRRILAHLQARYWLATGELSKASRQLTELETLEQQEGCVRRQLGIAISQALLAQAEGQWSHALDIFARALRLAASEGYMTLFLPYVGWPTGQLLQASHAVAPELVAAILQRATPTEAIPQPTFYLPEPLTEQELRILGMLLDGRSNPEIAAELVIAVGTAKWHVHNILQKLGVANRAQAIVKAHELGLTG